MTVVFSVIFPENLKYFISFLDSLEKQTYKDFKLFLINDGVKDLEQYLTNFKISIIKHDVFGMTPFEIRLNGLKMVLNLGAESIIFADTDDLLCPKRVALSVEYLKSFPFICNDISLIDESANLILGSFWAKRLNNQFIFNINYIKDFNILGLGNSAILGSELKKILKKLDGYKTGNDWLFFSAAEKDLNGIFLSECMTLYRQHNNNIIGKKVLNKEQLLFIIKSKIQHYYSLKYLGFNAYNLDEEIELNNNLLVYYSENENSFKEQLSKINECGINFFWWEESNYLN